MNSAHHPLNGRDSIAASQTDFTDSGHAPAGMSVLDDLPVIFAPPPVVNGTAGDDFIHVSGDGLTAPPGYNDIPGATNGSDVIYPMGGDDIVHAGGGNDDIEMQANQTAADQIDGGDGFDTVVLNGDYSAGVTFTAATMENIESLQLVQHFNYKLVFANGNLEVDGGQQEFDFFAGTVSGDIVYVDDSAETSANVLFQGGASNDTFKAGGGQAYFQLQTGGNDTAIGGPGENTFAMGAALTAADTIVGGSSQFDQIYLDGDYSGGLILAATTISGVETITLTAGHSYNLTTNDGNVAAGQTLTIAANHLDASDKFTFDGSAEKDGKFGFYFGTDTDSVIGGAGDDIVFGVSPTTFNASDHFDGGAGNDAIWFGGGFSAGFVFSASMITNVELLRLFNVDSYQFTMNDANVAEGQTLTVDASTLVTGQHLRLDASAETNGNYDVIGGADDDTILTGAGNDRIDLSMGGNDIAKGGAGDDTFVMAAALTAADQIDGGSGSNTLTLNGTYSGLVFSATTIVNIESIVLSTNHNYSLTTNDANLASGQTMTVDGSALGSHNTLTFDGRAESSASFVVIGGQGADVVFGGGGNDRFDLSLGGNDSAGGGGGDDTFLLGAAFTGADKIDGGTGTDTVILDGDYSSGVTFQAATMIDVELLSLTKGHSYKLVMNDSNVGAGQTLTVDASALGAHDALIFDGSAETDGSFVVKGGAGNDVLTGGLGNDMLIGNGGNDTFFMGGALTAYDHIDGGDGKDTVVLNGDYSSGLVFGAATMVNVETLKLIGGHSYELTMSDGNVAAGQTLTVDASKLGGGFALTFDGSAEHDGAFVVKGGRGDDHIIGGDGADKLTGGKGNDVLQGGNGADLLNGARGNDVFVYTAVGQSTGPVFDTIAGFSTKQDKIDVWFAVTGVDAAVSHGALSLASFNGDLATALGAAQLTGNHAVVFTPDSGDLAGDTFLVVDVNGTAGYQAGQDLVIELDHAAHLSQLKVADFI